MRNISQYFEIIEKAIEYSVADEAEIEVELRDSTRGSIEGEIYFADGSRLEFTELVSIEKGRLLKRAYRYQYIKLEAAVFRYDNAPHHVHLETFPHHKHEGTKILPATEPVFIQVLNEAAALAMGEGERGKKSVKKVSRKRRMSRKH